MTQKDELDEIFVDKNEPADKKLIVGILKPYATIDEEGVIGFEKSYEKLKEHQKALIYSVCKKAMVLRRIKDIEESSGPTEISKNAQISENSAKHALFRDYKKLFKKEGKGYVIPNYNLRKVKEILQGDKNG